MQLVVEGRDAMNSKELNVNVPLATVESDSEEFEVNTVSENAGIESRAFGIGCQTL